MRACRNRWVDLFIFKGGEEEEQNHLFCVALFRRILPLSFPLSTKTGEDSGSRAGTWVLDAAG